MARYVIEPRQEPEIVLNELADEKLETIIERIVHHISDYSIFTEQIVDQIKSSLLKKFESKLFSLLQTLQSIETAPDIISCESMEQISKILNIQLTNEEQDYLTLVMYKESKDIRKLPYQIMIKKLEEFGCKPILQNEENKEEEDIDKNIDLALKEDPALKIKGKEEKLISKDPPFKKKIAKSNSDPKIIGGDQDMEQEEEKFNLNEENIETIDEPHMIEIAQKCFFTIAEKMTEKKMTVYSLYSNNIFKKTIDGEEMELLTPMDFLNGLRVLGIEDMGSLESGCLIKVLSINEHDKLIRVNDLVQIIEDYGIINEESDDEHPEGAGQALNFEELDNISMVLMLALTEYLIQAKIPLYQLLGNGIYKIGVKTKNRQKSVDIINSQDFFAVLEKIGVKLEENEHDNLKDFLCLDPKDNAKLYVKKIKKTIEEFAFNEELRTFARKCYAELADEEEEEQEEPGNEKEYTIILTI